MILVFAGTSYYPAGGAHDLVAVVADIETAEAALELARMKDDSLEWAHLWDTSQGIVVRHYVRDYCMGTAEPEPFEEVSPDYCDCPRP